MILTKTINIKITKQNIDHFLNLGYKIELKEIINIPIEHLSNGSHKELMVKCDECGDERELMYKLYLKNYNKYNKYTCLKCSHEKNERFHRFNFRKDVLVKEGFDINKSEHEIMLERKIYRIYDCGTSKYVYKNQKIQT